MEIVMFSPIRVPEKLVSQTLSVTFPLATACTGTVALTVLFAGIVTAVTFGKRTRKFDVVTWIRTRTSVP
jgi:uncharacterized membrane protein